MLFVICYSFLKLNYWLYVTCYLLYMAEGFFSVDVPDCQ